ncbi:MAG: hypothetical protein HEP71_00595 [Roseivirga sp.]|nr:hypothetical protein [Roseivirga sp.]
MKRNDYSNYNRGQEISGVTFQQHQNQVIESLNTVMLSLGLDANEKTVLWGLKNDGSGDTYNISAGAIFTQGEIFLVDAFSGTDSTNVPVLNPVTLEIGDQVRFADGSIEAVHMDYKYQITLAAVDSGEVNFADLKQLKDVLSVMLDVDAKLNTFKADIVDGASEGFDTLAEVETALTAKADQSVITQLQTDIAAANTYTDNEIAVLTAGAGDLDTFAEVSSALDHVNSGGVSSQATGSLINANTPPVSITTSGTILQLTSADIQVGELFASSEKPKIVTVFCDMFYQEEGTADDFELELMYRIGTTGSWESIRRKYLKSNSSKLHAALRGQFKLVTTPTDIIQFAVKMVHDANDQVYLSPVNEIEFDAVY